MEDLPVRVLLVEDDEDDYILIREKLSKISTARFDLEWVKSYNSALEALGTGSYDVCLLDYYLGEHSGLDLLRKVSEKGYAMPVIIVSAQGCYDVDKKAMNGGAADYLAKDQINSDLLERSIRYSINRKRTEEELKESRARYQAIVEDQTELICRFRPDGAISFANDAYCCCFGQTCDELIGTCFMLFIPEEDRAKLKRILSSLCPEKPVATYENCIVTPDGQTRWQQWTIRRILNDRGRFYEYQAVGRDTTERKKMEEAIANGAEKVKLLAYSIAHDLKSPAVGIHGLARLLKQQYRGALDEKGRSYCDQILKASEQVVALLDEVNLFIKTKETPLTIEEINVDEILQVIEEEFSLRLRKRNIAWITEEFRLKIRADRLSIIRALRNLVDNALKYGGEKLSKIRVLYEESSAFHVLSVHDDGAGIRGKDHEKIFRAFQREPASESIPGMGLGLAIVKEIAERHLGSVWVESGPEGGTTFFLAISKGI